MNLTIFKKHILETNPARRSIVEVLTRSRAVDSGEPSFNIIHEHRD